jgi:hypothetical protein
MFKVVLSSGQFVSEILAMNTRLLRYSKAQNMHLKNMCIRNRIRYSFLLIYLFVVYLMTLSVAQTIQRRMVGRLMNTELERMWKEAVVV